MAAKYWRTGLGEMWRSFSKRAFVRALQQLVPEIQADHLTAGSQWRASTIGRSRRRNGGRLFDPSIRTYSERLQRALASGHRIAQHWPPDCRKARRSLEVKCPGTTTACACQKLALQPVMTGS